MRVDVLPAASNYMTVFWVVRHCYVVSCNNVSVECTLKKEATIFSETVASVHESSVTKVKTLIDKSNVNDHIKKYGMG